eukprot:tig00020556_g10977.t1
MPAASPAASPRTPSKGKRALLALERVIGLTSSSNAGFASLVQPVQTAQPATGAGGQCVVYAAGCVLVFWSTSGKQRFIHTGRGTQKAISAVAASPDGKLVAAGEAGKDPGVLVFDSSSGALLAELKGHSHGVAALAFSSSGSRIASAGYVHDGSITVWDWKSGAALASARVSTKVTSLAFDAADESLLLSAGVRMYRYWTVPKGKPGGGLEGQSARVGSQRDATFVDVGAGAGGGEAYGLTERGVLCLLGPQRAITKWVDIKARPAPALRHDDRISCDPGFPPQTPRAFALSVNRTHVACACADGVVRVFKAGSLEYCCTLPRPPPLGSSLEAEAAAAPPATAAAGAEASYADAVAVRLAGEGAHLTVLYSDRSCVLWDIANPRKVGRVRAAAAHAGCIWGLEPVPEPAAAAAAPEGPPESPRASPAAAAAAQPNFATCSADGTVRLWALGRAPGLGPGASPGLVRVVHASGDHSALKARPFDPHGEGGPPASSDAVVLRALRVSPCGRLLATGDRAGNIRVHETATGALVRELAAHEADVLALDFSPPSGPGGYLLASASRDRIVHVFDAANSYELARSLDEHSSSVTGVRFASGGSRLVSCSADRSVVFRSVGPAAAVARYQQSYGTYGTVYDVEVDPSERYAVTCGQDKRLSIWNLATGKLARGYKLEAEGEPLKVKLDPSGVYCATSSSDKGVRLYDFFSGDCIARVSGHSEVVTGLRFTADCTRLVTASADGTLFVWRLAPELTRAMRGRLAELKPPSTPRAPPGPQGEPGTPATPVPAPRLDEGPPEEGLATSPAPSEGTNPLLLSVTKLPAWAKKNVLGEEAGKAAPAAAPAVGRSSLFAGQGAGESAWARRAAADPFAAGRPGSSELRLDDVGSDEEEGGGARRRPAPPAVYFEAPQEEAARPSAFAVTAEQPAAAAAAAAAAREEAPEAPPLPPPALAPESVKSEEEAEAAFVREHFEGLAAEAQGPPAGANPAARLSLTGRFRQQQPPAAAAASLMATAPAAAAAAALAASAAAAGGSGSFRTRRRAGSGRSRRSARPSSSGSAATPSRRRRRRCGSGWRSSGSSRPPRGPPAPAPRGRAPLPRLLRRRRRHGPQGPGPGPAARPARPCPAETSKPPSFKPPPPAGPPPPKPPPPPGLPPALAAAAALVAEFGASPHKTPREAPAPPPPHEAPLPPSRRPRPAPASRRARARAGGAGAACLGGLGGGDCDGGRHRAGAPLLRPLRLLLPGRRHGRPRRPRPRPRPRLRRPRHAARGGPPAAAPAAPPELPLSDSPRLAPGPAAAADAAAVRADVELLRRCLARLLPLSGEAPVRSALAEAQRSIGDALGSPLDASQSLAASGAASLPAGELAATLERYSEQLVALVASKLASRSLDAPALS